MEDEHLVHEVRRDGNLFFLANAYIGAYNARTGVLRKQLEAEAFIRSQIVKLKAAREALDAATKSQTKGE